ncbi:MAG: hypothetical protein AB1603_08355 [Chloroflexota bacterium]
MSPGTEFGCLPTAVGSMPHTDPVEACRVVIKYLPQVPAWPQLPLRSFLESQHAQFAEGFPGLEIEDRNISVRKSSDFHVQLEKLYQAYLDGDVDSYPTGPEHAAGLHALLSWSGLRPMGVKGQITGPVTWGLGITGEGRPILYDETLSDAVARFLRLKAAWQEKALRAISPHTIIFVDEPSLAYFGSAFVSLSREQVLKLLNEVFLGISGLKGVHC